MIKPEMPDDVRLTIERLRQLLSEISSKISDIEGHFCSCEECK